MPNSILPAPSGYLRLDKARDLVPSDPNQFEDGDESPQSLRRKKVAQALVLRKTILAGEVQIVARRPDGKLVAVDLTLFGSIPQPNDGTVFTLVYLRPGQHWSRLIPPSMWEWLPTAELLVETASLKRWLRKRQVPKPRTGRPLRADARTAAETLIAQGRWSADAGTVGQLHQLLNAKGVLKLPISLTSAGRLARDLGYQPHRRDAA